MRRRSDGFLRLWQRIPAWLFGALGAACCFGYVAVRAPDYTHFWDLGCWLRFADGRVIRLPYTRVLIDLTFVLMGASFLFRRRAVRGPSWSGQILVAGLAGAWPMLPFLVDGALRVFFPETWASWAPHFLDRRLNPPRWGAGAALILLGNGLDLWGYATLFRSFSIVPEARALVTHGPFRWVRHPIYLGQFLAQAGIWLFFAADHGGWIAYYLGFCVLQLVRIGWEERVLEAAFGDAYRAFRRRSWWFWR